MPSSTVGHVDVQPLDEDGVLAVTLGTVAWLVAFAVLFVFFSDELRAHNTQWWLTVCLVGGRTRRARPLVHRPAA